MEKRKPHYRLEDFKRVCGDPERIEMTDTAIRSAFGLGFAKDGVAALVQTIDRSMFVKSMTSYGNHREWQDVYHVPAAFDLVVYLKFRSDLITEFLILLFKERGNGA